MMTISSFTNQNKAYGILLLMVFAIALNLTPHHGLVQPASLMHSHALATADSASAVGGIFGACAIGVGLVAGVGFAIFDGATLGGGSFLAPLAIAGGIHAAAVFCAV